MDKFDQAFSRDTPDSAVAVTLQLSAVQQGVQTVPTDAKRLAGLLDCQDVTKFFKHTHTFLNVVRFHSLQYSKSDNSDKT